MSWYSTLWGSIREPKSVTVVMVSVYVLLAASAVLIFMDAAGRDLVVWFAATFMLIGGAAGAPSAWLGWWWLEGVAAFSSVAGLAMLAGWDFLASLTRDHLPGYPLVLTVVVTLFFYGRALRVWPEMYAPGTGPITNERAAKARATIAELAADAAETDYRFE